MRRKRSTPLDDGHHSPENCSTDLRARILSNAPYFRGLPAQAIEAVNRLFRSVDYPAGAALYHEGDSAEALFLVAHGRIKLLQHSASGNEVVLDLLGRGDPFGGLATLGQRRYPQTAVAQTACCVLTITTADFRHLIRTYPEVALSALDGVARDLEAAHDVIRSLSTLPVEARIAQVLIDLADRLGESDESGVLIQSPLSQQDLAAMVASTAATVSRVISNLRRQGYVETGRQWIRIRDRDGLAQLAKDAALAE
ncbi:Crp/Fnr family transcriptional regulator [Marinobacter sp. 1-3A]|uniref:Crp/Fnr family transcriptional regulator n=1 Tax=Marinobacter sp. 1-3A TaxID=2582920 RepID=UPI001907A341|nr:Crp/Fnr family transcriptional regulator [Marinobacter sp. 1-3A]MBK1872016.1 Crp/Fnr family transcriptional regulator [Marinobacter sp. 1-3A]